MKKAGVWSSYSVLTLEAHCKGRLLGVMVETRTLTVMAVETDEPPHGSSSSGGPSALELAFANHSHAIICERAESLTHAIAEAEAYARRWRRGRVRSARCACKTIPCPPSFEKVA